MDLGFADLLLSCFGSLSSRRGRVFLAMFLVPGGGLVGIGRYDLLLAFAVVMQVFLVWSGLESIDELKAITLFHLIGFCLEAFKTAPGIESWSYPDQGFTKLIGVPLFSGFMYASVGSYIIQAWRLFDLRVIRHPQYWMASVVALLIYLNFFSHHFVADIRWYLAALVLGLYVRSSILFTPFDKQRSMPLLLAFVLIGLFIWLAENLSTILGVWTYPEQLGAWSVVHIGKWSSWSMLVITSFTIITHLKHIKASIHISE
jgi:uncharacterized membrane protein YoaT (DUF817 family)